MDSGVWKLTRLGEVELETIFKLNIAFMEGTLKKIC